MELEEFVLERLYDEDAELRYANTWVTRADLEYLDRDTQDRILKWNPARRRADLAVMRQIVKVATGEHLERVQDRAFDGGMYDDPPHVSRDLMLALAQLWPEHRDFDTRWLKE